MNRHLNDELELLDGFESCTSSTLDDFINISEAISNTQLSFLCLNINGVRSNFDELILFLNSIKHQYAIIGLLETNLTANTDFNFEIDGYKSISFHSKHGLKLYYKNHLNVRAETLYNYNDVTKETLFIRIKIRNSNDILFGLVYRTHDCTIDEFNNSISNDILTKLNVNQSVILGGDFNINLHQINNNRAIYDFQSRMFELNYYQSITEVTRHNQLNALNGTIIDHFWSRIPFEYCTHVIQTSISDHYAIALHTKLNCESGMTTLKFRDFSQTNVDNFSTHFPNLIPQHDFNLIDSETSTSDFLNWFQAVMN